LTLDESFLQTQAHTADECESSDIP
jgi:hypothetical protein